MSVKCATVKMRFLQFVLEICEDCYDEMKMESQAAGQDFYEYWEIDDE